MTHWVDKYLVPLSACIEALSKAREYPNPQSAWDAWDNGGDLLWALRVTNNDSAKRVLCVCDIVDRVLPIFEHASPKDRRPREALEAARRYMSHPTVENKHSLNDAIVLAQAALVTVALRAAEVARAAIYAAYAAYGAGSLVYRTSNAAYLARNVADDAERKAQADIVRKYFPRGPLTESMVTP